MKFLSLSAAVIALFVNQALQASEQPRGRLVELHSCELYAGGCTVSSESPLLGRQMVRAWSFTGGEYAGSILMGLQVAVLQSSSDNLAAPDSRPGRAVVYVPSSATASQRKALLAWVTAQQPGLTVIRTRTVEFALTTDATGVTFSAGKYLSLKTAPLESCDNGNCGESLWYTPRSANSIFTVSVNRASHVSEPALQLNWVDHGERSVFLARFGEPTRENVFVTTTDLCGPTGKLF